MPCRMMFRMIKKPKTPRGTSISFRVEDDLLAAIDAEVARVQAKRLGSNVSRADVLRELAARAYMPKHVP